MNIKENGVKVQSCTSVYTHKQVANMANRKIKNKTLLKFSQYRMVIQLQHLQ